MLDPFHLVLEMSHLVEHRKDYGDVHAVLAHIDGSIGNMGLHSSRIGVEMRAPSQTIRVR
jgi:hypothetical protein